MNWEHLRVILIALVVSTVLCGCGGGGGTSSNSVRLDMTDTQYEGPRSVQLNNYNNWRPPGTADSDYDRGLRLLVLRNRVCITESYGVPLRLSPAELRSLNPQMKVFRLYDIGCKSTWEGDWGTDSPPADACRQNPIPYSQIVENDWWLRDSHGDIVVEDISRTWILDVGKPGFKEAFLEHALERNAGKGFDGFVFDYWIKRPKPEWFAPGTTYLDYTDDSDFYHRAFRPFVEYVTAGLHAAGYSVVGNTCGISTRGEWDGCIDAAIYEGWALGWDGEWLPEYKMEDAVHSFNVDSLEVWTADFGLRSSDPDYARKACFGLAMYYVALPGSPQMRERRFYHHYGDRTVFWDSLWDFYIGTPVGSGPDRKSGECLYSRRFTEGLVLLNYDSSDNIYYTLDRRYHDQDGRTYSGTILVPARTGLILAADST